MNPYPINLKLKGKQVVVVGGGKVAYRKLKRLLSTKAKIDLISPQLKSKTDQLIISNRINYKERKFLPHDIEDAFLVIAATDNKEVNHKIAQLASEKNILVNVVDNLELSTFTVPAKISQGDLLLTVATGGNLPALSRVIKERLISQFGTEFDLFLELMGQIRPLILNQIEAEERRKKIFRDLADLELIDLLRKDWKSGIKKLKDRLPVEIADKLNY